MANPAPWVNYPAPKDSMPRMGKTIKYWRYNSPKGECIGYVAKYKTAMGIVYKEFAYGARSENVRKSWNYYGWAWGQRPLYGLDLLAKYPDKTVFVCNGEESADIARELLPDMVCLAWRGGINTARAIKWDYLSGRDVILLPINNDEGIRSLQKIGYILTKLECNVQIVNVDGMPDDWNLSNEFGNWNSETMSEWLESRIYTYTIPIVEPRIPPPLPEEYLATADKYPEPINLFEKFAAQPLKRGLLPKVIDDHVFDLAEVINTDPAFGGIIALSAVAGLLDDRIKLKVKDGFYESARLWTICCGESSAKKSPIMDAVLKPVDAIAKKVAKDDAIIKQKQEIADARYAAQLKKYTIASLDSKHPEVEEPKQPERYERRRIKCDVLTREGLERALQDMPSGVYIHNDEISAWIGSMDAYKAYGVNADRPLWLRAYNGGQMQIDKVGAGSYIIENWSATISGGIQPAKLAALASKMDDDGLLQRFLIVTSNQKGGQAAERAINTDYADAWRQVLEYIADLKPNDYYVRLSVPAYFIYRDAVKYIYRIINSGMISKAFITALGKWEGIIARMMLCFHVVDCAGKIHPTNIEVSEVTAQQAVDYMIKHILQHMVAFYESVVCETDSSKGAKFLAAWLVAENLTETTTTQMHKDGPYAWRDQPVSVMHDCLDRMVEFSWLIPKNGIDGTAKRPTQFTVNPRAHLIYQEEAERTRQRQQEARELQQSIRATGRD